MTHWKKLTNPKYLGAYAFDPGEEKVATIASVAEESIPKDNGEPETKLVAYFEEPDIKPLILNKTNMKAIEKAYETPYIEQWEGLAVILCVQKVSSFGGDIVDAVRIRPMMPPTCESCGKPIRPAEGKTCQEFARYTQTKYKKKLCSECAEKVKK